MLESVNRVCDFNRLSDLGLGLRGCNSDDETGCHSSSSFVLVPTLEWERGFLLAIASGGLNSATTG